MQAIWRNDPGCCTIAPGPTPLSGPPPPALKPDMAGEARTWMGRCWTAAGVREQRWAAVCRLLIRTNGRAKERRQAREERCRRGIACACGHHGGRCGGRGRRVCDDPLASVALWFSLQGKRDTAWERRKREPWNGGGCERGESSVRGLTDLLEMATRRRPTAIAYVETSSNTPDAGVFTDFERGAPCGDAPPSELIR